MAISASTGQVKVGTNNDKTGYTVSTNNDKTGYSLTQSFPANFADLAITASTGRVTVGTNSDKTGYSLTQAFPANFADLSITATTGLVSAGSLSGFNANGSGFTAIPWNAAWDAEVQSEANDALVANNLDRLMLTDTNGSMPGSGIFGDFLEWDAGAGKWRFTLNSLEQAPTGSGGNLPTPISPTFVDPGHTWRFEASDQLTAVNVIHEVASFDALVGMAFDRVMPSQVTIANVTAVTAVVKSTGAGVTTELVVGDPLVTPDKKGVHIPVGAGTAGTYTITVTIKTTDNQTYARKGELVIE
jgi:hypothetical protein